MPTMPTLGSRIKAARNKAGLTQDELAEKIGVSKQTLYKYEKDLVQNIPDKMLEAIADATGTTAQELDTFERRINQLLSYYRDRIEMDALAELKKEHEKASRKAREANRPQRITILSEDPEASERNEFSLRMNFETMPSANLYIRAKDDSMIGANIHEGDLVFLESLNKMDPFHNGCIYAICIDHKLMLRTLYVDNDRGIITLLPANPAYPPIILTQEGFPIYDIFGIVTGTYHPIENTAK